MADTNIDGDGYYAIATEDDLGQPAEFREDAANDLRGAAEWLDGFMAAAGVVAGVGEETTFVAAVELVIQSIHDLLGDHTVARSLAISWGTCTTFADQKRELVSAKGELDSYWEGNAKAGFDTYIRSATGALDTAAAKFAEMSARLASSIRYIYRMYGEAIDFLVDASASAIDFIPVVTASAIKDLVKRVGDLVSVATATTGAFAADATVITTLPSQLTLPAEVSSAVDEADQWKVAPT